MPSRILADWRPEFTAHWNQRCLNIGHRLHLDPSFGLDALAELIDRYPRSDYALVHTSRGADGAGRWREGDIGGLAGYRVIEAIEQGSMWLNLRDVGRHSPAHRVLLDRAYAELRGHVPDFEPQAVKMGILISSPLARVHYHCDLPGQALWQIHGRKQVRVYPARAPYLDAEALENIAYSGFEFKLRYEPEFDQGAEVFELAPGGMLTWPLNSPHRVENHAQLNVSVTTEHWTPANRRSQKVLLANGVLRHRLGWAAASRATEGPGFWVKSALQAAWRRSPWSARVQRAHRPIEFRLDPGSAGGIADLNDAGP